jgi:hypothetical protein
LISIALVPSFYIILNTSLWLVWLSTSFFFWESWTFDLAQASYTKGEPVGDATSNDDA